MTLDVPPPLDQLPASFVGGAPLPQQLKIFREEERAAAARRHRLDRRVDDARSLADRLRPEPLLYDVICSLTFRVPMLEVGMGSAAPAYG